MTDLYDYHNGPNLGLEPPAVPQDEPSDEEILAAFGMDATSCTPIDQHSLLEGARALLARYGAQPAAGEEIMVNALGDVYTLPMQPSGLTSGPRFVVHVPAQPAASAEPVAQVSRKGFHRGSIVWTAAGLVADLPDGTNLYAAPVAAQPKRRPYNTSGSLSEYGVFPECDAVPAAQAEAAAGDARDRDAARYRLLRRKVCLTGGEFHILNLDPHYIAADAAANLDAAIDRAMKEQA